MIDSLAGRRLVYFSAVPLRSYSQRPHFLVQACLDAGFSSVLWVEPYPTRLPRWSDLRRARLVAPNGSSEATLPAKVRALSVVALPFEPLPAGAALNRMLLWRQVCDEIRRFAAPAHSVLGVGKPSALAEWALDSMPHHRSFFDVLDNFPAFHDGLSHRDTASRFQRLLDRSTDVFCSSSSLLDMIRPARPDAIRILNGYASDDLPAPSAIAERDCIGYIGTIGRWFDWPLVVEIARALPDVAIVLIGPEFVGRPLDLPANVELVGEIPQSGTGAYLQRFRVGLIPFMMNDLTDKVDPIKYYEYGCMGIPIWSTPFGEMRGRQSADGVQHVSAGSPWRALWNAAARAAPHKESIASFRRACSWSERFEPMMQQLSRRRAPSSQQKRSTEAA